MENNDAESLYRQQYPNGDIATSGQNCLISNRNGSFALTPKDVRSNGKYIDCNGQATHLLCTDSEDHISSADDITTPTGPRDNSLNTPATLLKPPNGEYSPSGESSNLSATSVVSLPGGSCLKGVSKCTANAHVQFDTTHNGTNGTTPGPLVNNKGQPKPGGNKVLKKLWSHIQSEEAKDEAAVPCLKKPKKKRHFSSGSSSLSIGSSSTSTSDSRAEFVRRAPDGGWGWVVVFASFMVHCIADGVTMSFGVLYVEFLNYFQESKSVTSWVGSLFMAIPLLAGPLASWAADRYGCRTVTIWGSMIACVGFLLSSLADSIVVLFITVGVITGLGLAFCYVAAIVIVAFYFEKKRSLATGISVAGSGIGTFVFAPLIQYLLKIWGWRGCLVILAGAFLNMVVAGLLMRDLEWTRKKSDRNSDSTRAGSTSHSADTLGGHSSSNKPSLAELRQLIESGAAEINSSGETPLELARSSSLVLLPTFINCTNGIPHELLACLSDANAYEVLSSMYPHLLTKSLTDSLNQAESIVLPLPKEVSANDCTAKIRRTRDFKGQLSLQRDDSPDSKVIPMGKSSSCFEHLSSSKNDASQPITEVDEEEDHPFNGYTKDPLQVALRPSSSRPTIGLPRKAVFRGGTRTSISGNCARGARMKRQSMTFRGAVFNIHRYRLRSNSCPNIYKNSIISGVEARGQSMTTYLKDLQSGMCSCMSNNLCTDIEFVLFGCSNFLLYVFYDTVYMYLMDYAQGVGISPGYSADLISVIGILNCIGMVLMGYIGDRSWSSPIYLYLISMIICGLSVIVMPFLTNYWLLAAASATFGFFISANYALTSVILVEIISLDAFSKAYGIILLIQGIANLIGPPLVGYLADSTGSYLIPFVVSGVFIVLCGLMLVVIPIARGCHGTSVGTPSSDTRVSSSRRVDV